MSAPIENLRAACAPRLLLFLLLAALLVACSSDNGEQEPPPPSVVYQSFEPIELTISAEYAGRARGSREVEVRARVDGILLERLYNEGQRVDRGDPLFQIDPQPYQIALMQAEAERGNARARHAQAEREWQRVANLHQQNAISDRERDQAQSQLELAEAGLALADAGVSAARLNLDWTEVIAPIEGNTGMEILSEGSLVSAGTLLTTLSQTNPIHVRFALPEQDAALQRAIRSARSADEEQPSRSATLKFNDGREYAMPGVVDFTDISIDPRTGSVSARAVFDNPDGEIMPGQFVRLQLTTRQFDQVMQVPERAVVQGHEGSLLYLVDDSDRIQARPVELGPVVDGGQVVLSGLEPGERVVVSGLNMLQPDMRVQPRPAEDAAPGPHSGQPDPGAP